MNLLWLLTKKNLKLLIRAKASAFIILFGPLLLMLILGVSYNSSDPYSVKIGVHASSFTPETQKFMEVLQKESLTVVKYEQNVEKCIDDLKTGVVHACLKLPDSFAVQGNSQKEILFYLDPSRIHLASAIQQTLQDKFNLQAREVSQQLSQDLLFKLTNTKNTISEKKTLLNLAKEKSALAVSGASAVQSSLTGLDVALPQATYDPSKIEALSSDLGETKEKITQAITLLENANLSGGSASEATSLLSSAADKLTSASTTVGGNSSDSVISIFSLLQTDLENTKSKLTAAATAIGNSASQLGTTTSALQESSSALDTLSSSLNEIQNNLESQQVTDPSTVAAPLIAKVETVAPPKNHLNYLFSILLMVVVMFTSLLLGTTLVMMEKTSPAFLRNYFVPVKKATFIASTYLTTIIVMLVQVSVILAISLIFIKELLPVIPVVFGVLFLSSSVFTFLGMGLGYLFTSEETGVLAAISLGSSFLFLSGVILPVESLSTGLRGLMSYNPFVVGEKVIREIVIFNNPLEVLSTDLLILLGYGITFLLVILVVESLLHKHFVQRFLRHRRHIHPPKETKENKDSKF